MPRNGSGTFSFSSGYPYATGTVISSTDVNANLLDIANNLTSSVSKDGQTTMTGNLPMGGFKLTSVADATLRDQYSSAGQVQDGTLGILAGVAGTNTITGSLTPSIGSANYTTGMVIRFVPANNNTGAVTLSVNSLAAKNVYFGGAALAGGELNTGKVAEVIYDGTQFELQNPYTGVTAAELKILATDSGGAGMLADIAAIAAPGADKVLGWDSSGSAAIAYSLSTGLTTSGTDLLIDTSVVPRLAAANTFTDSQTISGSVPKVILSGSTPQVVLSQSGYDNYLQATGSLLELYAASGFGIQMLVNHGSAALNIDTSANATVTGTLGWGGGSAISSSDNVPKLNASNTFNAASLTLSPTSGGGTLTIKRADKTQGNTGMTLRDVDTGYYWTQFIDSSDSLQFYSSSSGGAISISSTGALNFRSGSVTTANDTADEVGFKGVPIASKSANYTTVLNDADTGLYQTGSSATFTIDDAVAYPIGTVLVFSGSAAFTVTCSTASYLHLSGTSSTGARSVAAYGEVTATKYATHVWIISGTGLS